MNNNRSRFLKLAVIGGLFSIVLMATGCARMQRIEKNVDTTQKEVTDLRAQVKAVQQSLDDLNVSQGGATNSMKADLTMQLKQLDTQLDRLLAEMDESQHRLLQLEKKVDVLANQRMVLSVDTGAVKTDSSGKGVRVLSGLDIEKMYNQSRDDYVNGKYDLAFKGFKSVYDRPEVHTFKESALFWMAECHYKQQQWEKSLTLYQQMLKEFPKGNKSCSGYFKLGMIHAELKQEEQKKQVWNELIQSCPGSNEALRAKDMLQ